MDLVTGYEGVYPFESFTDDSSYFSFIHGDQQLCLSLFFLLFYPVRTYSLGLRVYACVVEFVVVVVIIILFVCISRTKSGFRLSSPQHDRNASGTLYFFFSIRMMDLHHRVISENGAECIDMHRDVDRRPVIQQTRRMGSVGKRGINKRINDASRACSIQLLSSSD